MYVIVLTGMSVTIIGPFPTRDAATTYGNIHFPLQGRVYPLVAPMTE